MESYEELGLFETYDRKKTAAAVKWYFNRELPKYARLSGLSRTELGDMYKSPIITDMPSSPSHGNGIENNIIKVLSKTEYALRLVRMTAKSIELCDKNSRVILFGNYFKQEKDWQLQESLNYGKTQYSQYKIEALNQFADTFEAQTGWDLHRPQKVRTEQKPNF